MCIEKVFVDDENLPSDESYYPGYALPSKNEEPVDVDPYIMYMTCKDESYTEGLGEDQRSHAVITALSQRGGMQTAGGTLDPTQPRSMMIAWALQKAAREAPQASQPTVQMICKAEMRTVMALMNARTPTQTRQVLEAAYRRAGLPSPFAREAAGAPNQQTPTSTDELKDMVTAQGSMIAVMSNLISQIPTGESHQNIMWGFKQSQDATVNAIRQVTQALEALEKRLERLEINQNAIGIAETQEEEPHTPTRRQHHTGETPTPVYSTPARSHGEPEQDQQNQLQQQTTLEESQDTSTAQPLPASAVVDLVDDDNDDEPSQPAANSLEESTGVLATLAQRSSQAQARRSTAMAPFGTTSN